MGFDFSNINLVEKSKKILERNLNEEQEISAVLSFNEDSVYNRKASSLEGVIVITGPVMAVHVFINRGMGRKYLGVLPDIDGVLSPPNAGEEKSLQIIRSNEFHELIFDINKKLYPGVLEHFKTKELNS